MVVKILGISCSPRNNSNSRSMLEHAMTEASKSCGDGVECDIIDLRDYKIEHCNGCGICGKTTITGEYIDCLINDEAESILKMMENADGFVISTPVKLSMPSDLFTKFMNRTRILKNQDFKLANKPVGVMSVSRRRSGGGELAIMQVWMPFIRHGCLIVGGGGKVSSHGAVGWASSRNHVLSDDLGLEEAVNTVMRVIEVASLLKHKDPPADIRHEFCYRSGGRIS